MKTKTITQIVFFDTSPEEVYNALMDSAKHSQFTGGKANISQEVGGAFSAWDGYIDGINKELIPGKKIVQTWRAEEDSWPRDHYSKVIYSLKSENEKTKLEFTHKGVPEDCFKSIEKGWKDFYWEPMKKIFAEK